MTNRKGLDATHGGAVTSIIQVSAEDGIISVTVSGDIAKVSVLIKRNSLVM